MRGLNTQLQHVPRALCGVNIYLESFKITPYFINASLLYSMPTLKISSFCVLSGEVKCITLNG